MSERLMFFHAHVPECDPVCVLESFGRDWKIEWAPAAPAGETHHPIFLHVAAVTVDG